MRIVVVVYRICNVLYAFHDGGRKHLYPSIIITLTSVALLLCSGSATHFFWLLVLLSISYPKTLFLSISYSNFFLFLVSYFNIIFMLLLQLTLHAQLKGCLR